MKTWKAKWFGELTRGEPCEILRIRFEIFAAEQQCDYKDIDGMDEKDLPVFAKRTGGELLI